MVPFRDVSGNRFKDSRFAFFLQLEKTASGADFDTGCQIDLDLRMRQDIFKEVIADNICPNSTAVQSVLTGALPNSEIKSR